MKSVVVIGQGRSATSMIAKGLSAAGVHMGDRLIPASSSNRWGHYEDKDFVWLNNQILKEAGGAGDDPPAEDAILEVREEFRDRVVTLLESKVARAEDLGSSAWGWKDPRTVLTWPLFGPLLEDPIVVIVRRDVRAVADSLRRRDKFSHEKALGLAREYARRIDEIERSLYS